MPGLNLTRDEALARAGVISEVIRYDIELALTRGDTDFGSRTRVEFTAPPRGAQPRRDAASAHGPCS